MCVNVHCCMRKDLFFCIEQGHKFFSDIHKVPKRTLPRGIINSIAVVNAIFKMAALPVRLTFYVTRYVTRYVACIVTRYVSYNDAVTLYVRQLKVQHISFTHTASCGLPVNCQLTNHSSLAYLTTVITLALPYSSIFF